MTELEKNSLFKKFFVLYNIALPVHGSDDVDSWDRAGAFHRSRKNGKWNAVRLRRAVSYWNAGDTSDAIACCEA